MKVIKFLMLFVFIFFLVTPVVFASSTINIGFVYCRDGVLSTFKLLNVGLTIIRVVVPLLLIIFGTIDFGKSIFSNDEQGIKNALNILVKRGIAGITIFFIPTILKFAFGLVYNIKDADTVSDFQRCTNCLLDIKQCS